MTYLSIGACSPVMESAWREYQSKIEDLRQYIYSRSYAASPEGQGAHYLFLEIQAVAFNVAMGCRQYTPRFFMHLLFEPTMYPWTSPNADLLYRKAFVDGKGTYRIYGTRNTSHMLLMQIIRAYWNDPVSEMSQLGEIDFDELEFGPDGSFEIIASPEPHSGNWIRLDPTYDNNCLLVREAFNDWEAEFPSELHIERLDGQLNRSIITETEFIERIRGAVRFMEWTIGQYSMTYIEDVIERVGWNTFASPQMATHKEAGINPLTQYFFLGFDIKPDEALYIVIHDLDAHYWGIQSSNLWNEVNDYIDHQSSLNGFQITEDEDGIVRIVVCATDPGVPNWIDTVGLAKGALLLRLQKALKVPTFRTSIVKLAQLNHVLPRTTKTITIHERRQWLKRRRNAGLRRWGY